MNQNRFSPLSELGNEMGTDQINKSESLGGFDFTIKSCKAYVSTASRLVRVSHLKWWAWGKTQPKPTSPCLSFQKISRVLLCGRREGSRTHEEEELGLLWRRNWSLKNG